MPFGNGGPFAGATQPSTGGGGGGSGTVTSVSVNSANGLGGTVTNPTTAAAITLDTTVTGLLKGNGTAISAATAGTDYPATGVISAGGPTGSSNVIPIITWNANGQLTTVTSKNVDAVGAYNALNYGVVADGVTDDTAAWNTLFATILTNGGGIAYLPGGKTSLCTSALIPFPFVNNTAQSPPLRIMGAGAAQGDTTFVASGASVLDLRYNGGGSQVAKIDTRGYGQLEIDHLTLKSGGTDDYPFFQTTNTAVYGHDLMVYGHSANSGTSCVQDGFILGGTNTSHVQTGDSDAIFQGYTSRFDRVNFEHIRIGFNLRAAANAITFNDCVFSSTCGGDSTHAAFTVGASTLSPTGNSFIGNTIEFSHYPYCFLFSSLGANYNKGFGNWCGDSTGTSLAAVIDAASTNAGNRFFGTLSDKAGDHPDVMSVVTITSTGSYTPPVNGNYHIECVGGGGQGGGGSGAAGGGGGGGAGSGGTARAVQTLAAGTAYTCTIGAGGSATGGGGASGIAGTSGSNGGGTTFAGTANVGGTGGGGGQGGQNSGTTSGGTWGVSGGLISSAVTPGTGGVSVAAITSIGGTGAVDLAGGGGGAGGIVGGGKGGGGGGAGTVSTGGAGGTTGASGTTAGVVGSAAAANSGAGGGGGGCGDAATGGTGGAGGSGFIRVTGPYPN